MNYIITLKQTGEDAPLVITHENSIGTVTWFRDSIGSYKGVTRLSDQSYIVWASGAGNGNRSAAFIPICDYSELIGYYVFTLGNSDGKLEFYLEVLDANFEYVDLNTLFQGGQFCLPEIRIYPA